MPHLGHWTETLPWCEEEEATLRLPLRAVHTVRGYEGLGDQDAQSSATVMKVFAARAELAVFWVDSGRSFRPESTHVMVTGPT